MRPGGTGQGANLVGVPSALLASTEFNDAPRPLRIAGVHETHPVLFHALENETEAAHAAVQFEHYMNTTFRLDQGAQPYASPRRFRASYLRLLRGWGFDSNSREGAVLKSWVENRFGIYPTFHKMPLTSFTSAAWSNYVEEKMSSRFHNNAIFPQLDLLYEFCQWSLRRWCGPQQRLTLYRGINDFDEHRVVGHQHDGETAIQLNNLVSFSANRSVAGQFGDYLLEVDVPKVKVVFYSELLPHHPLKGEAEYMVIGGDYRVMASYV